MDSKLSGFVLYCNHGAEPAYLAVLGKELATVGVNEMGRCNPGSLRSTDACWSAGHLSRTASVEQVDVRGQIVCWTSR